MIKFFVLPYPMIDPIAVTVGPFSIHWYALAYVVGVLFSWKYGRWLIQKGYIQGISPVQFDGFINHAIMGILVGGRIGFALFYRTATYLTHPLEILAIWKGGMSFHGAVLGLFLAILLYAKRNKISLYTLADMTVAGAGIGIFLGRIANFINGEHYGRPTDLPWGMVFPVDRLSRHPSQLYEALLEGLVLFALITYLVISKKMLKHPGFIAGFFFVFYALMRWILEYVRTPDGMIMGFTTGQILSLPLLIVGIYFMVRKNVRSK